MVSKKEVILNNLSEFCINPVGDFSFAKPLMNQRYYDETDYYYSDVPHFKKHFRNPRPVEPPNIIWEEEPKLTAEDKEEIRQAFLNEIKNNPQDWKIEKEGKFTIIKHKSGRKHWQFNELFKEEWSEMEQILSQSKNKQNGWGWQEYGLIGGGIVLILAVIWLWKKYL